jgi:hypothetical protein
MEGRCKTVKARCNVGANQLFFLYSPTPAKSMTGRHMSLLLEQFNHPNRNNDKMHKHHLLSYSHTRLFRQVSIGTNLIILQTTLSLQKAVIFGPTGTPIAVFDKMRISTQGRNQVSRSDEAACRRPSCFDLYYAKRSRLIWSCRSLRMSLQRSCAQSEAKSIVTYLFHAFVDRAPLQPSLLLILLDSPQARCLMNLDAIYSSLPSAGVGRACVLGGRD